MKWIARVLVFMTTLVFGTFVASLFWSPDSGLSNCTLIVKPAHIAAVKTPIKAENLLGTWKGTWGHSNDDCTIEIDRVNGNAFSGTLRKEGAVILFEGTFNPKTRMLYFNETKVVRLGTYTEWSLGKNSGVISPDGRTLVGSGHDKWGQYDWDASNY
jgi:hypothetical protein